MALPSWSVDEVLAAAKLDTITEHLQGLSGSTDAWHLRSTGDTKTTLGDAAGANGLIVFDSAGDQMAKIDSQGVLTLTSSDVVMNTTAGLLKHEAGGIEADISAVVIDDIPMGSGTGTMGLGRGWVLQGETTTETTTTSTGDIVTVAGLSIATTKAIRVEFDFRKTTGAAVVVFGLKFNTTEIISTNGSFDIALTADNEAQSGHASITCGPRDDATFLGNVTGNMSVFGAAGIDAHAIGQVAAQPGVAITTVVATVQTNASSLTAGIKNLQVYTLN